MEKNLPNCLKCETNEYMADEEDTVTSEGYRFVYIFCSNCKKKAQGKTKEEAIQFWKEQLFIKEVKDEKDSQRYDAKCSV